MAGPRDPPTLAVDLRRRTGAAEVGGLLCLAEDDGGEILLPCIHGRARRHGHTEQWWDRPLNYRNPLHWPYVAVTFVTGWIVMVEPW